MLTMTGETAFNAGMAEARIKFGAECRPVDETLHALRAVLKEGGREYEVMDLYNRWHAPISFAEGQPLERLIDLIIAEATRIAGHYRMTLGQETRDRNYIITHAWDQVRLWDFKRQVLQLIETDIRRHKPGLRKNNVEFKRLAQMVFAEAQMAILQVMADKLTRQMGTLRIHLEEEKPGTIAKEAAEHRRSGEYLISIAGDLRVLGHDSELLIQLQALAAGLGAKGEGMLQPVHAAIEAMERVWYLICEVQVTLTHADKARRDWHKTLEEADKQGLKGIARRDFEGKAGIYMDDAMRHQLEADKMLRSENLLTEQERMTCDF